MRYLWTILSALALTSWITFILGLKTGLPAFAPLLSLAQGVWRAEAPIFVDQPLSGLKQPVRVAIDKAGVPHIFADHEEDAYRAQGFLMASQRSFQMELSGKVADGRLTEWVGDKGRESDLKFVKLGLRQAIAESHALGVKNPQIQSMVSAFVGGANAAIAAAQAEPLEAQLLGIKIQPLTELRVFQMAKTLTYNLNGRSYDLELTQIAKQIGPDQVLDLYPEFMDHKQQDVIFIQSWGAAKRAKESPSKLNLHVWDWPSLLHENPRDGSNNWAVAPSKSSTGKSIFANDTHLSLNLPNVWYEIQLHTPTFNVYGVSLINVPGIINGFNGSVAWGPTNGTTDAFDYYEAEFESETSWRYRTKSGWQEAEHQVESVGGRPVDLYRTSFGPVIARSGRYGLVADWLGLVPGRELEAVHRVLTTKTAKDCLKSFDVWISPLQNFICASETEIGLRHSGFVPGRAIGRGRFVAPLHEINEDLWHLKPVSPPLEVLNPPSGYILSANQNVVEQNYPGYLGWDYESPYRAMRIREHLAKPGVKTPQDFIAMQNDPFDKQAQLVLPNLLRALDKTQLSPAQMDLVEALKIWDFRVLADKPEGSFFKAWFINLKHNIFDDDFKALPEPKFYPKDPRISELIDHAAANPNHSDARWIDDQRTTEREGLAAIALRAFVKTWDDLQKKFGQDFHSWTWARYQPTQLAHVARIPAFGVLDLPMNGSSYSINGNGGVHGAVYKIVVALGEPAKAWIQVPGGNEGRPLAKDYARFSKDWAEGKMREVEYYKTWDEAAINAQTTFTLRPSAD